jgi:DNA-binding transcriptional ArsR family regulator
MAKPKSSAKIREQRLSRVFHALADPTRRKLVARLAHGPARVTDLAAPFDISLAAVSKHLVVLEKAGLAGRRIEGREHRCSLDPAALREIQFWLDDYRIFWSETLGALKSYVEKKSRAGG